MKTVKIAAILAIVLAAGCTTPKEKKAEIAQFRGPDRTGMYYETDLITNWPDSGLVEVFYLDSLGFGYGSPSFVEDRFYLASALDSTAILYCFSLEGKEIWRSEFGKEWVVNFPGSRSTPTVFEDHLYVGSGYGNLYCFNALTGEQLWHKDLQGDFDGILPRFGHAESPLIDGDVVYWVPGGEEYNVVAMNRFTGDLIWSTKAMSERSGYNPPMLISLENRKILVTFSAYHLLGLDAETGELLWTHEQTNTPVEERKLGMGDTHANSIVYDNGSIYYAAGDGNGGVRLDLSPSGDSITEAWVNPAFDCYMGGILKIEDQLYGSGTRKPFLYSADANTGGIIDSLKIGRGATVHADSMLYFYTWRGELHQVGYQNGQLFSGNSMKIKKGDKEHFAHPVFHRGLLYIRHGNVMLGYDLNKPKA